MNKTEGQNLSISKEPEMVVNLSRTQMKEELLRMPKGVAGMVWHVGSDPSVDSFDSVVVPEAMRFGFVSWVQGSKPLESMVIQPHYFPNLGLNYNSSTGKVVLDESKSVVLQSALTSPDGFDFDPNSAPGWHELIKKTGNLRKIELLKTQIASPTCSQIALSENLIEYQPFIYKALMRGHIDQARKLAPRVVISMDDPNNFSTDTLRENFKIMFGDVFNSKDHLISTDADVMRAIHCCGDYDVLGAMETGAIDVVHYDAWKYGPAPLVGRPDILKNFIKNNGIFAWGGIPQSLAYLQDLGKALGIYIEISSDADYAELAKKLNTYKKEAFKLVSKEYLHWLENIAKETSLNTGEIARKTFISASCGYGGNPVPALREFAYSLSRTVADLNRDIAQ